MAADGDSKGLKSVRGQKPLRSRGFLSQPGGAAAALSGRTGGSEAPKKHHLSRGGRQITAFTDSKPQALEDKPRIKPYRLEDK
ncbi:hypothetical protein [Roseibium aggregatum]|uniref:Uncharacterized protein n=1 Tax=Roseibium aggregatum TaxID=187304 RepID=A0A939IYA7_9HYPH|nr:hypothetical protein [Roseibium aggregatum]MBN9668771.1 hypothetical protein [Roseibium aggregatum]